MPRDVRIWVESQVVAAGINSLPDAAAAQPGDDLRVVVVESPSLGPVRITYQRLSYRHGKSRYWHWVAVAAEMAMEPTPK